MNIGPAPQIRPRDFWRYINLYALFLHCYLSQQGRAASSHVKYEDQFAFRVADRLGHAMEHRQRNDDQLRTVILLRSSNEGTKLRPPQLHIYNKV